MVNKENVAKQAAGKIYAALKVAGRSAKWLSEQSGTPYATLHRQLAGKTSISIGQIAEYADCLGIDPTSMLPESFFIRTQELTA